MSTWLLRSLDDVGSFGMAKGVCCMLGLWLYLGLVVLISHLFAMQCDIFEIWRTYNVLDCFLHHTAWTVCVVSIGIVYASSFLSMATNCCFASCLCTVLDLAALALIVVMDTIEWAGAIGELVDVVLMSHLPILEATFQLVYFWLGLLHFLKWSASDERAMLILDSPLVLTILMRCECAVSLKGKRPLLYASVSSESPYLVEIVASKRLVRASQDHRIIASQCGTFAPRSRWPLLELHSSMIAVFDGASSIWYLGAGRSICHLRKTCPMYLVCTLSTAAPPVDRSISLQLILHLTDGSHKVRLGLFLNSSSVVELYRCVKGCYGDNADQQQSEESPRIMARRRRWCARRIAPSRILQRAELPTRAESRLYATPSRSAQRYAVVTAWRAAAPEDVRNASPSARRIAQRQTACPASSLQVAAHARTQWSRTHVASVDRSLAQHQTLAA